MDSKFTILEKMESTNTSVEIIQYNNLEGSSDVNLAAMIFYAQQSGMRLKQVKITLRDASVVVEAGSLHYMKGNITTESSVSGIGGFAKKLASNMLTKESSFKPTYRGSGEIFLEPTFGNFVIVTLNDEEVIVDKGMFHATEASVSVGVAMQKNISSALFGGEGFFQTKLTGRGWCVLESPVPANEIVRCNLNNEKLCVDGNFALLRRGRIEFRVERSTKSFVGSLTAGEGLLQTFTGTGEVWLAPTQSIYERIRYLGLRNVATNKSSAGQNT